MIFISTGDEQPKEKGKIFNAIDVFLFVFFKFYF